MLGKAESPLEGKDNKPASGQDLHTSGSGDDDVGVAAAAETGCCLFEGNEG